MSGQPLWLRDLVAYSMQVAALVGMGVVLVNALRLRAPRFRLAYWQALLMLSLVVPLLQPWRPEILETPAKARGGLALIPTAAVAPAGIPLAEIIFSLICAGIIVRGIWTGLGLMRLGIYRREARRLEEVPGPVEEARRLAPTFAAIFISDRIRTPATFGYFHPVVIFPARFLKMAPSTQKLVALHEFLHVERRDWLWNVFEELVLTFLWFEVPLWWVVRGARLSREEVVDAEAVRRSDSRGLYLNALLEMAGQKGLAGNLPASLFLRENQLAERVSLMMKEVRMSRVKLAVFILTLSGALLTTGALAVYAFPLRVFSEQRNVQTAPPVAPNAGENAGSGKPSGGRAVATKSGTVGENTKAGQAHPRARVPEPKANVKSPHASRKGNDGAVRINSAELRRQIEQALKKAELGRLAASRIDQAKIQQQIDQALKKARIAQSVAAEIDQAKIQQQVERALKQAKVAQQVASRIDEAKIRQQFEQAMKQADAARAAALKIDEAKIQREIKHAQEILRRSQRELRRQLRQAKPMPPAQPGSGHF